MVPSVASTWYSPGQTYAHHSVISSQLRYREVPVVTTPVCVSTSANVRSALPTGSPVLSYGRLNVPPLSTNFLRLDEPTEPDVTIPSPISIWTPSAQVMARTIEGRTVFATVL